MKPIGNKESQNKKLIILCLCKWVYYAEFAANPEFNRFSKLQDFGKYLAISFN